MITVVWCDSTAIAPAIGSSRSRRNSGAYTVDVARPQPIEEVDVPVDVERVGSALAVGATEPFELAIGEVETVHRHDDRGR